MNGTIVRRPRRKGKPSFQLQVSGGVAENGKRIRISKTFTTRGEAEQELARIMGSRKGGQELAGEVITLGTWIDRWLETHVAGLAYYTSTRYKSLVEHLRGPLGSTKLAELRAIDLERVYAGLYETLSARTVRNIHGAISAALARAVKLKLLTNNVAAACTLRPSDTREAAAIDASAIARLEEATADSWLGVIVRLAADTGARRGELLALRWSDLNFDNGRLIIKRAVFHSDTNEVFEKSTKTKIPRAITLSRSTLAFLEMHRDAQQQARNIFGSDYRNDLDLIFARPNGDHLKPRGVSNAMRRVTKKLGLDRIGIHSLRHSHGSLLLADGVPLAVVSKRLGHSSPHTTMKIYSHAMPADEQAAAERWDAIRNRKPSAPAERAAAESEAPPQPPAPSKGRRVH